MARNETPKASGNDGSWFLEAVGAVPASPTPSETIAALEEDNTTVDLTAAEAQSESVPPAEPTAPSPSFDGSTGTSTSTYDLPVTTEAQPDSPAIAETGLLTASRTGPDEAELSPVLRSRRAFRWPALAFGIFVIVVAAAAAFWLPEVLRQDATATQQSYADAALNLRRELPNGQATLGAITNPASTSTELDNAVPSISQLDSAAHELTVIAAEPFPRQLPVFPVDEVSELGPLSDTAQIAGAQGTDIARRIGYTYVYLTTIPVLLATDDLPSIAGVQRINALSVSLASALVEASSALGDLPTTEETAAVEDLAHDAIGRFALWQDEYLNALAESDETTVLQLIAELESLRVGLDEELWVALSVLRVDIDAQIVELASDLDAFLVVLSS